MRRKHSSFIALLALAGGCDPECPPGYVEKSGRCYICRTVDGLDGGACIIGDAAVSRDDEAGGDSGMDGSASEMDSGAPDVADASDDAESTQEDDASAGDADREGGVDEEATSNCPAGTADGGTSCQTDPCDESSCGTGFTCNSATSSCMASCASSDLGCQPGDPCSTDEECRTGGDENASCEPTDKVCITVCPTTSIVSELNLNAARYCREIDGDLIVNPNFATVPANALPYLTRIRGRFNADLVGVLNTSAQSLTFSALQRVDGNLAFALFQNVTLLSFPRLTSIGGNMLIALAQSMERLSLPQLTTVQGRVEIGSLPVSQLDIGRLQTIGDTLAIGGMCNLPWSQISGLAAAIPTASFANIGCCTGQSTRHSCDGACVCD